MWLHKLTWPQVKTYFQEHDTVLLTVGSCECHGTHLPLGTDTIIPEYITDRVQEKLGLLAVPTVPFGASDYFLGFPGTLSIGTECLQLVLQRLTDSLVAAGAKRFVIVNGHGGNIPAIEAVCYELSRKGVLCAVMNWWQMAGVMNPAWKGGHAGGEETAAIMVIDPELVDWDAVRDGCIDDITPNIRASGLKTVSFRNIDVVMPRHIPDVTDNGWTGADHPNTATAQWGSDMLEAMTDYIVAFTEELMKA